MKKIAVLLATLLLVLGVAFAENQETYTFVFKENSAGNGEMLDLSEYGIAFFLPEFFLERTVSNNENAICYYERQTPKHAIEFLKCGYSTLEDAKGEYKDVTPVSISVNGLDGIAFPYMSSRSDGTALYITDAFLDIPGYGILNFYEEADNEEDLALYLPNIQAADTASESAVAETPEVEVETAPAATASSEVSGTPVTTGTMIRTQKEGNVNVRKTPDSKGERVGVAKADSLYPLLSITDNGWYEIQLRDGTVGFIHPNLGRIAK